MWKSGFIVTEILWLVFVGYQLTFFLVTECVDEACRRYDGYQLGLYFWRGIAVGLLIWLAYRFAVRRFGRSDV
jgi:hypothetical protein